MSKQKYTIITSEGMNTVLKRKNVFITLEGMNTVLGRKNMITEDQVNTSFKWKNMIITSDEVNSLSERNNIFYKQELVIALLQNLIKLSNEFLVTCQQACSNFVFSIWRDVTNELTMGVFSLFAFLETVIS